MGSILLQKMFVRPERYRIGLRLGFAYATVYSLQLRVLFQLFQGFSSLSITSVVAFCDFYNKSSLTLFEVRRLALSNLSSTVFGTPKTSVGCLQLLSNRFIGFCDSRKALIKSKSCFVAASLPYFLSTCSYFLMHRTTDFHLRFLWFPLVSLLGNRQCQVLNSLQNVDSLGFLAVISFFETNGAQPFKSKFLYLLLTVLVLSFNALIISLFILKHTTNDNR